ncbi:5'-methylthioadenosine phosphorylase [Methanohalophilus levihalophilus]|uniref:MTAP family purine nucleoside phosphorylase n=1 Tax=Methanohalophilus levihalophilus TaxID=1431282 RepID=UPI001AEABB36|nr:MTAP family purine nucleoside phosphorylase [Methanohalophilus levihalophilus]MBP2029390.1 5'-methylthioadenosine phosphorylase [Methanohalophilus levihalophilus]
MNSDELPEAECAIIGGVGTFQPEEDAMQMVSTPFGEVEVFFVEEKGVKLAIIPRHVASGKHTPPHMINYRANIKAVEEIGVKRIIATNSVGSMQNQMPGTFFIPDDFIDFTKMRPSTFFDDKTIHIDMGEPYCPQIREALIRSLSDSEVTYSEGTYICTEGPRFETKAEIRMLSQFGDVVGMTGLPEVVLAKELQLCYASICTIANPACGLNHGKLTTEEVLEVLDSTRERLLRIILNSIKMMDEKRTCSCRKARENAGL